MSARQTARKRNGDKAKPQPNPTVLSHGAADLPSVHVDTYNEELRDPEGFVGDRASNRAFHIILDEWRERLRRAGADPLGDDDDVKKKKLDKLLAEGDPEEAGLVQSVIEEFAQEFAAVVRRFMRTKAWEKTGCIVVGGGLCKSRVGQVAIGRTAVLLKADGCDLDLKPITHHPDTAGLIGNAHLAPSWILEGHDAILGVDIGGSNIRVGLVDLKLKKAPDLSKSDVADIDLWCYSEEKEKPKRDEAIGRLAKMLRGLIEKAAKRKLKLAPFVGIGCPGLIREDGSIERGAQNLPGNWESKGFNLPQRLHELIPTIGEHSSVFIIHNDAVVQGLSEVPFMREVKRWGVMTLGTGLGNAHFTTIAPKKSRRNGKHD